MRALFHLTWRQLIGWHRLGLLIFLCVLWALPVFVVGVTLATAQFDSSRQQQLKTDQFRTDFLTALFDYFQLPLLYPVIALLLTATVLRKEIQNETILYLWTKPISRSAIVISKYIVALFAALLLAVLSVWVTGAMLISDWVWLGKLSFTVAIALLAYGAFFFALSMIFDRALIWGFVYILGWELLFSRISSAASELSIRHYAENLERSLFDASGEASFSINLAVLLGLTVAMLGLAIWRFSQMEFTGNEEG